MLSSRWSASDISDGDEWHVPEAAALKQGITHVVVDRAVANVQMRPFIQAC